MTTYYVLFRDTTLLTGDVLASLADASSGDGRPTVIDVPTSGMEGLPLRVFGVYVAQDGTEVTYWVRGAAGSVTIDRTGYALADPLAPLNTPVAYYLASGSNIMTDQVHLGQYVRGFSGRELLTTLPGTDGVEFDRMDNGDPRAPGIRAEVFAPAGATTVVSRWDATMVGTSQVLARTEGATTRKMTELLETAPMGVVLHNPARCDIPGCDVPLAQVVTVTATSSRRVGTVDVARRDWSLDLEASADPYGHVLAPVRTLAQWDAAHTGSTLGDLDVLYAGMTLGQVDDAW